METSNTPNKYENITDLEHVIIDEDYPYYDVPDLPHCKFFRIYNRKIGKIGNLPVCEKAEIISCLTGEEKETTLNQYYYQENTNEPLNLGNLQFIGDLPRCKTLYVHAFALKRIGNLDSCENLRITNESEEYYYIKNLGPINVLIENDKNSIVYTGHHDMTVKDTVLQMLENSIPFDYISFNKTKYFIENTISFFDLSNINFNSTSFLGTRFERCDLSHCDFRNCTFKDVIFEGCILDYADLSGLSLGNTVFRNCTLFGVNLKKTKIPPDLLFILYDMQEKFNLLYPGYHNPEYSQTAVEQNLNPIRNIHGPVFEVCIELQPPYTDLKREKYPLILKSVSKTDIDNAGIIVSDCSDILNRDSQVTFYFSMDYNKCPAFLYNRNHNIIKLDFKQQSLPEILQQRAGSQKELTNLQIGLVNDRFIRLANQNFSQYHFKDIIFESCNLSKCNFYQASFNNVYFIDCIFHETNFTQSGFINTIFKKCELKTANFDSAKISPFIAGQLREQENFSECFVNVPGGWVSTAWFNRPDKNIKQINIDTVWDTRNLYVVIDREMSTSVFIGPEKECYSTAQIQNYNFQKYYVAPLEVYLGILAEKYSREEVTKHLLTMILQPNFPEISDQIDRNISNTIRTWNNHICYHNECMKVSLAMDDLGKDALYFPNTFRTFKQFNICYYLLRNPFFIDPSLSSQKRKL